MSKIIDIAGLENAVKQLQERQRAEFDSLKIQVLHSYNSLKPANIIRNTLHTLSVEPDFKGDLLNAGVSLAAGFVSKKIAVGSTHNPIKQLLGTFLQMSVTHFVAKNADSIKETTHQAIKSIFGKKEEDHE
jgi:hypothetical protein